MKIVYPTWFELQFNDNNGKPLTSGLVYTKRSDSGANAVTYNANDEPNTNPVLLDLNGRAVIRLDSSFAYKFIVHDSNDVLVYERDKVYGTEVIIDGGIGTDDHTELTNRDANNQHPTSAITGLDTALSAITGDVDQLIIDVTNLEGVVATKATPSDISTAISTHVGLPDPHTQYRLTSASVPWGELSGVPASFTPSAHTQAWSTITSTPTTIAGYGITNGSTFTAGYNQTANLCAGALSSGSVQGWTKICSWGTSIYSKKYIDFQMYRGGRGVTAFNVRLQYMQEGVNTVFSNSSLAVHQIDNTSDISGADFALFYNIDSGQVEFWFNDITASNQQYVFKVIATNNLPILYYGASATKPTNVASERNATVYKAVIQENANLLTGGGDTALHYHASDRLWANITSKPTTLAGYGITDALVTSVAGKTGVVTLVKADVGLGNVDNTSDLNKPISTATQTALNATVKTTGDQTIIGTLGVFHNLNDVTDDYALVIRPQGGGFATAGFGRYKLGTNYLGRTYVSEIDATTLGRLGSDAWIGKKSGSTNKELETSGKMHTLGIVDSGKVETSASTTVRAGINLPHGTAPTSPVNGDKWTTTAGEFTRVNGVTYETAVKSSLGNLQLISLGNTAIGQNTTTNERGHLVRMINGTGATSVKGTPISASTTTDNQFVLQANEFDAFGVVAESGIASGQECWIWVNGSTCEVLWENGQSSTRGYLAICAPTDGRALNVAVPSSNPTVGEHFKEIGHVLQSKASGTNVLVLCQIHFN